MALCSIALAAGMIGAVVFVKRMFFWRRFGERRAFGCEGHGPRGWRRHWGGPGRSFWLRGLFYELDTTPGQEREIRAAVEDLQRTAYDARGGLGEVRAELARAMVGEVFDEGAAGEASARVDAMGSRMKEAMTATLKRVHAVLDPHQRKRLAEIFANGVGFRRRWGSPYRDAAS
jgi:Spy/CpxP family protein refolding chaperone